MNTTFDSATWKFPALETDRLHLRLMTLDDAPALFELFSDDDVTRFMDIESFTKIEQAEAEIAFMNGLANRLAGCRYGIFNKATGRLIGTCGFNSWEKQRGWRSEIGYDLAKAYWGQGIMKEALSALLMFGFSHMNLHRIEALVLPDAKQSMSVLRKLGFTQEGLLRGYGFWVGQFWDEYIFSLLRDEWLKK